MRLYFKYLSILLQSQMQYRVSFWLLSLGQFLMPFAGFAGLYLLFDRFGQLQGWSFIEVALCFAIIHLAFAVSECFARGFDSFSTLVVSGEFDRLLLRPRSTVLQVLGSRFEFTRIGRMAQSLIVFVWAIANLNVDWSVLKIIALALMVVGGIFIFAGIFMLAAAFSFWTIEGLEIANIFTDGGREMAQYPLDIYKKWAMRFFTFVIPFGCVNYLPLLYILDKTDGIGYAFLPLFGIAFVLPCLAVWKFGVRHYRSTGS